MTDAPGASDVTVNTRYAMKRYRTGYNTGHAEGYQAGYLEGIKVNSAQTAELNARVADTTVQLANQYQRIERFVELVDQLEAQLAQTWQPVNEKFILTYDTGLVDTPKQFVRWNADDESVLVGKDDGSFYHCPLPDNIRLCRLVTKGESDE